MKKKNPQHPRLYLSSKISSTSNKKIYKYLSNEFIEQDRVEKEEYCLDCSLSRFEKNQLEYDKLKKFIKIQKIVLKKHKKDRNYDAENIVKSSIILMENFRNDFNDWFRKNKV